MSYHLTTEQMNSIIDDVILYNELLTMYKVLLQGFRDDFFCKWCGVQGTWMVALWDVHEKCSVAGVHCDLCTKHLYERIFGFFMVEAEYANY